MKKTLTIGSALISAALAASLLASCAPQTSTPSTAPNAVELAESSAPTPSPEPLMGDLDGDGKLSVWEGEQLAKSVYTLPDGTTVPIPKGEPLPQVVLDAVKANIAPSAAAISGGTEYTVADFEAAYLDALKAESAKTGRTIIGIFYGWDYSGRAWVSSKPYVKQYGSKEEAIASVEAYIGDKTDRLAYVVFD